jgi:trimethylamine:corrinoid methyltransferase-like protein
MNRAICSGKIQIKGVDFKVLSDDEIADIHYASLEILEKPVFMWKMMMPLISSIPSAAV